MHIHSSISNSTEKQNYIMVLYSFVLIICSLTLVFNQVSTVEFQFDQVKVINSTYREGLYNISLFRIAKFNRTTYVLKLEIEYFVDVDDDFETDVSFYYNRLNNNQYTKSLMRVPKDTFCSVFEKNYDTVLADAVKNNQTNYPPKISGQKYGPFPKVRCLRYNFVTTEIAHDSFREYIG